MVQFFHCRELLDVEKSGISRLQRLFDTRDDWLAITNYKSSHPNGREIDVILFAPGTFICIEMKSWPGTITVPDKGPWILNPRPKGANAGDLNPIVQSCDAHYGLRDFLKSYEHYNKSNYYISYCVYLSNSDVDLLRPKGADPDIDDKIVQYKEINHDLALHISHYHPDRLRRTRNISLEETKGILQHLGIPYNARNDYVTHLGNLVRSGTKILNCGFAISQRTKDEIKRLAEQRAELKALARKESAGRRHHEQDTQFEFPNEASNLRNTVETSGTDQSNSEPKQPEETKKTGQVQSQHDSSAVARSRAEEKAQREQEAAFARQIWLKQVQREQEAAALRSAKLEVERKEAEAARRAAEQAAAARRVAEQAEAARRAAEQAEAARRAAEQAEAARRAAEQAEAARRVAEQAEAARRVAEQAEAVARLKAKEEERREREVIAKRAAERQRSTQDKSAYYNSDNTNPKPQNIELSNEYVNYHTIKNETFAKKDDNIFCTFAMFDEENKYCSIYSDGSIKLVIFNNKYFFTSAANAHSAHFDFMGETFILSNVFSVIGRIKNRTNLIVGSYQSVINIGFKDKYIIYSMYDDGFIKADYENTSLFFSNLDALRFFKSSVVF